MNQSLRKRLGVGRAAIFIGALLFCLGLLAGEVAPKVLIPNRPTVLVTNNSGRVLVIQAFNDRSQASYLAPIQQTTEVPPSTVSVDVLDPSGCAFVAGGNAGGASVFEVVVFQQTWRAIIDPGPLDGGNRRVAASGTDLCPPVRPIGQ